MYLMEVYFAGLLLVKRAGLNLAEEVCSSGVFHTSSRISKLLQKRKHILVKPND